MSQIYNKCQFVIAWLGSEQQVVAAAEPFFDDYDALCLILDQPYWRRLWVVQEMLLPQKVRVLCGGTWLLLTTLYRLVRGMLPTDHQDVVGKCSFEAVMMLNEYVWNTRITKTLHACIQRYSGYICHDKRDKICGLLGWVVDAEGLIPDYNKTVGEVLVDTVRCLSIKHEGPWPHPDHAPVFLKTALLLARDLGITADWFGLLARNLVKIEDVEPDEDWFQRLSTTVALLGASSEDNVPPVPRTAH